MSIHYKYHSSLNKVGTKLPITGSCRSFISIIVPNLHHQCVHFEGFVSILYKYHSSLDSYHQTLLLLKCRSFISIIVPWLCRTIKMHKDGRCRSFISIIVPLNKMKLSSTQDIVSILYKYHSSLKLLKLITLIFYTSVDPL